MERRSGGRREATEESTFVMTLVKSMADSTVERRDLPALKGLIIESMFGFDFWLLFLFLLVFFLLVVLLVPTFCALSLDSLLLLSFGFALLFIWSGSSLLSSLEAHSDVVVVVAVVVNLLLS